MKIAISMKKYILLGPFRFGLIALFLLSVIGCGKQGDPNTVIVKGIVAYNQDRLPRGTVVFKSANGNLVMSSISEEGTYELRVPEGSYRVGVMAPSEPPKPEEAWKPGFVAKPPIVPSHYGNPEKSGIRKEVTSQDVNQINIDINDPSETKH